MVGTVTMLGVIVNIGEGAQSHVGEEGDKHLTGVILVTDPVLKTESVNGVFFKKGGHGFDWPKIQNKTLRRPGIEPGSTAWKAAMLTIIPPTLQVFKLAIDACIMVTFALIYHR